MLLFGTRGLIFLLGSRYSGLDIPIRKSAFDIPIRSSMFGIVGTACYTPPFSLPSGPQPCRLCPSYSPQVVVFPRRGSLNSCPIAHRSAKREVFGGALAAQKTPLGKSMPPPLICRVASQARYFGPRGLHLGPGASSLDLGGAILDL